jgi:chromosome segregation ATPase
MAMNELGEIRQRRAALVGSCSALEAALSAPAASARWPEGLGNALGALLETFGEHVAETEASGGTIEQLRERAPRLSERIDRLSEQHATITADTERLMDRIDHAPAERSADENAAIREQALELLTAIVRHRQLGADLLYEAYDIDVGGVGG